MGALFLLRAPGVLAVTCTTQSQMTAADRTDLASAVERLSGYAAADNTSAIKQATLGSVAADFSGIASTIDTLAPLIRGAHMEIENLYGLSATDLKLGNQDDAEFFCAVAGSQMLVTVTIPGLPPGNYALATIHADGVAKPQQMGMILARDGAPGTQAASGWQLAGFFTRPLTMLDHDGIWYWTRARELAKEGSRWSAYFYYQNARYLLMPVDFISSPNLTKLDRELTAVKPEGLPGDTAPAMTVQAGETQFAITSIRTDGSLGGLDLVLRYNAAPATLSDPVAARAQALQLMNAMLQQHGELRANFHGLWVYEDAEGRSPFAVELPMNQIQ
jgi:hypothetical protein